MLSNNLKIRIHKIYRKVVFNLPYSYLPDFLIIGAQKAGTTTLFNYLIQHPAIKGSLLKEVNFFNKGENYSKGIKWYSKHFKNLLFPASRKLFFEATPDYMINKEYLNRIHHFNPTIKLIVILRDPVSRAFSAWNFFKKFKHLQDSIPDFKECIAREMQVIHDSVKEDDVTQLKFLRKGFYTDQLRDCFDIFGRDNVLVLMTEDLQEQPIELLNRTLSFLGVMDRDWSFLKDRNRNVGVYKSKMDTEIRTELKSFFNVKNRELEILLGVKLNW